MRHSDDGQTAMAGTAHCARRQLVKIAHNVLTHLITIYFYLVVHVGSVTTSVVLAHALPCRR